MKKILILTAIIFLYSCSSINMKENGVYVGDFSERSSPRYVFIKFNSNNTLYWSVSDDIEDHVNVEKIRTLYNHKTIKEKDKSYIQFNPSYEFNGRYVRLSGFRVEVNESGEVINKNFSFIQYN